MWGKTQIMSLPLDSIQTTMQYREISRKCQLFAEQNVNLFWLVDLRLSCCNGFFYSKMDGIVLSKLSKVIAKILFVLPSWNFQLRKHQKFYDPLWRDQVSKVSPCVTWATNNERLIILLSSDSILFEAGRLRSWASSNMFQCSCFPPPPTNIVCL